VFTDHGWRDFRLSENLDGDKSFQLHVKMKEIPGDKWQGDITIMDWPGTVV
jgi:hypothetical protein